MLFDTKIDGVIRARLLLQQRSPPDRAAPLPHTRARRPPFLSIAWFVYCGASALLPVGMPPHALLLYNSPSRRYSFLDMRLFFRRALLLLLIAIASCAPRVPTHAAPSALRSEATRDRLLREYQELRDSRVTGYLTALALRLMSTTGTAAMPQVHVLRTQGPFALSTDAQTFILSEGLLRALSSESECAFVLAHEIAHGLLGHHRALAQSQAETVAQERAADLLGVRLLYAAGYPATDASTALRHIAIHLDTERPLSSITHPDIDERVALVEREARHLSENAPPHQWWLDSALERGREFSRFQAALRMK